MSHVASLTSVLLLTVAIVLGGLGITQPWWTEQLGGGGPKSEITLWDVELKVKVGSDSTKKKSSWDDVCMAPTSAKVLKAACEKVKAARAFLILACVFSFFAATGNAAGIKTGNTLIDAAAGVVAGFSCLFTGIGLGLTYMTDSGSGLTSSTGWMLSIVVLALQFVGSICGCIGTCQEMHEIAKLAASLHIGVYKTPEATAARSAKAAKLRDVEEGEAKEMYANLNKRKRQAEEAAKRATDPNAPAALEEDDTDDKKKKVPVMLKRVLFRKPAEGDDDEIPTKMLEDAFAEIDGDGSGSIELAELVDSLKLCGLAVSAAATDTVMKEIDKNASGDVDLREFIEFFRHIEDLNRFSKKTAARAQFLSFLLNFCFLADIVVVGIMLMMFIRMDKADNPDNYSIMKNVLLACSVALGILFLLVILMPILRLALGPTAARMQIQYELAQEVKKSQRKKMDQDDGAQDTGPRQAGYTAEDPPPPVNAAMFGRSYRPGKVDSNAWTPAIEDLPPLTINAVADASSHGRSSTRTSAQSIEDGPGRQASHQTAGSHSGGMPHAAVKGSIHIKRANAWRYDPSNYSIAANHASMMDAAGLGPTSWTPMQVRDVNLGKSGPAGLPGVPLALTDASFPQNPG